MSANLKLIYVFDDDLYPDDFPRIVSNNIVVGRISNIPDRELLQLFYGFTGRDKIMLNAGMSPYQGTGSSLRGKIISGLERGEIVAIDTFPNQLATIGPFYVDEKGYLQPYQDQGPGYPVARIIRRYEEMVRYHEYRARPTIFPARRNQERRLQPEVAAAAAGMRGQNETDPQALTKAQRWQQRKNLIGRGERSVYPDAQIAAKRLAENNVAVEKAKLAQNIYGNGQVTNALKPMPNVPEGWRDVSNDEGVLKSLNLDKDALSDRQVDPDFFARIYQPEKAVFGDDMNTTLVFRGSRAPELTEGVGTTLNDVLIKGDLSGIKNVNDWFNNFSQGVGADSPYYKNAVLLGRRLQRASNIDISGHSLGGGMASAASLSSGKPAWTFNAAGLNSGTVEKYGAKIIGSTDKIQAYRVQGELLTKIQEGNTIDDVIKAKGDITSLIYKEELSMAIPDAAGVKHTLPGGTGTMLDRHGIDQAIQCIEDQKDDDIAIIRSRT
ncbi:phospholipase [Pluralibacter gergoviae]|uniref:phospholipase n=2 Tax=Pluralibacter gergoviae TaxID=61647 RepID=UPI00155E19BF|nr:phospholipase [Pluralibacter gergoviae]